MQRRPSCVDYRAYWRCLPGHLRDLAAAAHATRARALAGITSADAIARRGAWVTETLWARIGGRPDRSPLHVRTVGELAREGYRVEKLIYESQPGIHVPANLYLPCSGDPPFPGVLFQPGHHPSGKAAPAYQRCCQALVKLGYAVLAFDHMGEGERAYYPLPGAIHTRFPLVDEEHSVPGRQMLLVGLTATQMQLWDAVRSLDVLASHPLVDPTRLAATGQSGGGTMTMFLVAVDDRLIAAAPACANTEDVACVDFNPPGSTDDAEQNLIGAGPLGLDRWDLLYPFAPRPLAVLVSAKDAFGLYSPNYISSGRRGAEDLGRIYEILGARDRLLWHETPLPHGLSVALRLEIYRWFDRWVMGGAGDLQREPPTAPEPEEVLFATRTGNIARDLGGMTPFLITKARATALPAPRPPASIESLLGLRRSAFRPRVSVVASAPGSDCEIDAIEVRSARSVWIPAWLFKPVREGEPRSLLIALEPEGRNLRWQEDDLWPTLARAGRMVCAPDVRGIGDLTPEVGWGAAEYAISHAGEESYAWASLILGESLLAQRVSDLISLVEALSRHPSTRGARVVLAARGAMTVPALFAAAIDARIGRVYLASGLASYRSLVESEDYTQPFASFLPGVLLETDLPEIAGAMAKTKVTLAGPVDARGQRLPIAEARELYRGAANVDVLEEGVWDLDTFLGL